MGFEFGSNQLCIDRVEGLSQAGVWLEVAAGDVPGAAKRFGSAGVVRRDEIEPLPEGNPGFWIQNPASIIHMVAEGSGRCLDLVGVPGGFGSRVPKSTVRGPPGPDGRRAPEECLKHAHTHEIE